jgi:hypothetical protein
MSDPTILPITGVLLILILIAYFLRLFRLIGILVVTYAAYFVFVLFTASPAPVEQLTPIPVEPAAAPVQAPEQIAGVDTGTVSPPDTIPIVEKPEPEPVTTTVPVKTEPLKGSLSLNRIVMATDIKIRTPVGIDSVFTNDVGKLYCFTGVQNLIGDDQRITHFWKHQNRYVAKIDIMIGRSYNWRCWSQVTIQPRWTGTWEVVVLDSIGNDLGSIQFEIVPADSI